MYRLRRFKYVPHVRWSDGSYCLWEPRCIVDSLGRCTETLEYLQLNASQDCYSPERNYFVGHLQAFKRLNEISMDLELFVDGERGFEVEDKDRTLWISKGVVSARAYTEWRVAVLLPSSCELLHIHLLSYWNNHIEQKMQQRTQTEVLLKCLSEVKNNKFSQINILGWNYLLTEIWAAEKSFPGCNIHMEVQR